VSEQPPDQAPDGWQVLDPDGNVVATGPQTEVSAEAGQEQ
jgi:hypothetical protein